MDIRRSRPQCVLQEAGHHAECAFRSVELDPNVREFVNFMKEITTPGRSWLNELGELSP
jgi:hypothetical protein